MDCRQSYFTASSGWVARLPASPDPAVQLVLVFGSRTTLTQRAQLDELRQSYPEATIAGCSTAGEILGTNVIDDSLVATAVRFEHTEVRAVTRQLPSASESLDVGRDIARSLCAGDLAHVVVFSDGLHVNGSRLVAGLEEELPSGVIVTGGLAGDGERFEETLILADDEAKGERVTAIGFYGSRLRTGHGSLGGWDPFGPERLVTRSDDNVLYELDGRSALGIYRRYLGPYEKDLPASALLFPLALRESEDSPAVVRTILAVDDESGSMIFAGDLPEGSYARFMKANFDRLLEGASNAAAASYEAIGTAEPDLALLVSCVGRRMVLKQRVEEEVESVRRVLGEKAALTGFYSYGEISPFSGTQGACQLHNQTMTITSLREV